MKRLYRIQIASAVVFALFLAVHLASVTAGLWGAGAFDSAISAVRPLYRNWPVEVLLLTALLAHTGVSLYFWWRRPPGAPRRTTAQLQTLAGFVLLVFVVGHVTFLRVAPALYGFEPAFSYLWTSLRIWPTLFVPYYILFGVAGAFHLVYGLRQAAGIRQTKGFFAVYLLAAVWMFAVGVRLPMLDTTPPDNAQLRQYLKPFETFTPWLIDMGEDHPLVRQYLGKEPLP